MQNVECVHSAQMLPGEFVITDCQKKQVSTQLVAQSTRTQVNSRPTWDSID